jgi:hypothetical protein
MILRRSIFRHNHKIEGDFHKEAGRHKIHVFLEVMHLPHNAVLGHADDPIEMT